MIRTFLVLLSSWLANFISLREESSFPFLKGKRQKGNEHIAVPEQKQTWLIPSSSASAFPFFWNLKHLLRVTYLFSGISTKGTIPQIHPAVGKHGAPTARGDSTHDEVRLRVVKSWPLESKPTGEGYFTSGTIKHFRTGSYSQHRALNVSSVNLWNEESSLPGLLGEEGDTEQHKQVRHWSNPAAWVIGISELLNRSMFALLSVLGVTRWVRFPGTALGAQWDWPT